MCIPKSRRCSFGVKSSKNMDAFVAHTRNSLQYILRLRDGTQEQHAAKKRTNPDSHLLQYSPARLNERTQSKKFIFISP